MESLQDEVRILTKSFEDQKHCSNLSGSERNESFESLKMELDGKKELVEKEKQGLSSTVGVLETIFSEIRSTFSLFKSKAGTIINLFGEFNYSRFYSRPGFGGIR